MKLLVILVVAVVLVGSIDGLPKRCRNPSDCPCGSQCVTLLRKRPCRGNYLCFCRRGCLVANIFIAPGKTNPKTYCNRCTCPRGSSRGIPACTKVAWCGLPKGVPLYPKNKNCKRG